MGIDWPPDEDDKVIDDSQHSKAAENLEANQGETAELPVQAAEAEPAAAEDHGSDAEESLAYWSAYLREAERYIEESQTREEQARAAGNNSVAEMEAANVAHWRHKAMEYTARIDEIRQDAGLPSSPQNSPDTFEEGPDAASHGQESPDDLMADLDAAFSPPPSASAEQPDESPEALLARAEDLWDQVVMHKRKNTPEGDQMAKDCDRQARELEWRAQEILAARQSAAAQQSAAETEASQPVSEREARYLKGMQAFLAEIDEWNRTIAIWEEAGQQARQRGHDEEAEFYTTEAEKLRIAVSHAHTNMEFLRESHEIGLLMEQAQATEDRDERDRLYKEAEERLEKHQARQKEFAELQRLGVSSADFEVVPASSNQNAQESVDLPEPDELPDAAQRAKEVAALIADAERYEISVAEQERYLADPTISQADRAFYTREAQLGRLWAAGLRCQSERITVDSRSYAYWMTAHRLEAEGNKSLAEACRAEADALERRVRQLVDRSRRLGEDYRALWDEKKEEEERQKEPEQELEPEEEAVEEPFFEEEEGAVPTPDDDHSSEPESPVATGSKQPRRPVPIRINLLGHDEEARKKEQKKARAEKIDNYFADQKEQARREAEARVPDERVRITSEMDAIDQEIAKHKKAIEENVKGKYVATARRIEARVKELEKRKRKLEKDFTHPERIKQPKPEEQISDEKVNKSEKTVELKREMDKIDGQIAEKRAKVEPNKSEGRFGTAAKLEAEIKTLEEKKKELRKDFRLECADSVMERMGIRYNSLPLKDKIIIGTILAGTSLLGGAWLAAGGSAALLATSLTGIGTQRLFGALGTYAGTKGALENRADLYELKIENITDREVQQAMRERLRYRIMTDERMPAIAGGLAAVVSAYGLTRVLNNIVSHSYASHMFEWFHHYRPSPNAPHLQLHGNGPINGYHPSGILDQPPPSGPGHEAASAAAQQPAHGPAVTTSPSSPATPPPSANPVPPSASPVGTENVAQAAETVAKHYTPAEMVKEVQSHVESQADKWFGVTDHGVHTAGQTTPEWQYFRQLKAGRLIDPTHYDYQQYSQIGETKGDLAPLDTMVPNVSEQKLWTMRQEIVEMAARARISINPEESVERLLERVNEALLTPSS